MQDRSPVETEALKNKCRTLAFKRVRDEHPDLWHDLLEAEYEKEGLEYKRPKTELDKARELIDETLAKFPDLAQIIAEEFIATTKVGITGEPASRSEGRRRRIQEAAEPVEDVDLPPIPEEPDTAPEDPVLGHNGADPAEDFTTNDYAEER